MKAKLLLIVVIPTLILVGCDRFNKQYFYNQSFGTNLRTYVESHESFYTDGVLELHNVSQDDDVYKKFFTGGSAIQSTSTMFRYGSKSYYASEQSPILYILVEPNAGDDYGKYILYLPEKKMMVFIYADAMGG